MAAPTIIPRNKYICPYQSSIYVQSNSGALAGYTPFNGYKQAPYTPAAARSGSAIAFTIGGAPADLSMLVINGPDGATYTFQFVRAGSVATLGIPIAVPAGGGTAAQTTTALLAALNAGSGVETDTGKTRFFPFNAVSVDATHLDLHFLLGGLPGNMSGTQATITFVNAFTSNVPASTVPGRVGMSSAILAA